MNEEELGAILDIGDELRELNKYMKIIADYCENKKYKEFGSD